jgi:tRNA dimethylallyltransferase
VLNGEVINIDSVQIYRELNIGSAKPSLVERAEVPHHCFDLYGPDEYVDAVSFAELVVSKIQEVHARGKVAILVGCPGMYLSFLFAPKHDLPKADEQLRNQLAQQTVQDLYQQLLAVDPFRAEQLAPSDRARIVRALECFYVSGLPQSEFFKRPLLPAPCRGAILVLDPDRAWLYSRINRRSQQMVQAGLLEETRVIVTKYGRAVRALGALGYKQALEVLDNGIGANLAGNLLADEIALHTRRYAKRQCTFWRNEPLKRGWMQSLCILSDLETVCSSPWISQLQTAGSLRMPDYWQQLSDGTLENPKQVLASNTSVWYVSVGRDSNPS